MKYFSVIGYSLVFIILSPSNSWSQELVCTAGDVFSNNSVQLEWSLGEPVIDTHSDGEIWLTQGFHQPYKGDREKDDAYIKVYPNPFDLTLTIEILELESENMYGLLIDMSGKLICTLQKLREFNEIKTADIPDGVYVLRLFDSKSKLLKSVKIIKLQQP